MNLNQDLIYNKKDKNAFTFHAFKVKEIMGPPLQPVSKFKNRKQKSNSTLSSGTNWGKSCHSVLNTSTSKSASTTISSEIESRVITAVTEGRGDARCEVGLASIDLSLPNLILCQISDSQNYINTLTKINILNPTDIIVPSTFLQTDSRLVDKIRKKFPNIKILGISRKTFNKSNGMDRILQLCLPSVNTICIGLQHKFYALAACSGLTTYLQNNLNIYYVKSSLNVTYQESEGYAIIDVSTADRLELVSSTKPAQASRYSTLFGVLNYCVTKVGARLLRSTILQPPSNPQIINKTLECISELIKNPEILLSVQAILQRVSNIDQLLSISSMTLSTTDSCSVRQLNYLLLLNSLIDLIEPLRDIIEKCQQPFFVEFRNTLNSENFLLISDKIRTMIHPSAQFAKSEAGVTQRCFAIKSDINGLLDLVRKTYFERLNDLNEYVRYLGNKYNLSLTLGNNNTKGYHIVLKLNNQQKRSFKKSELPPEFIQVYRLAGSCTMKTAELINLSTRLEDIMLEILKISNSMIYNIIVDLKQYVGFFYKLCEDIARLDMLQSLSEASRRRGYTKPKFGDFTELTNARHPMLELLIGEQRVANLISICQDFNVQIITGPNGSGKSIYIRQVMLLQVMAQVGCYVPADAAIFRPMDRMFARVYLDDDIEYGASSFILEMKEVKYMMTLMSDNSLFIIDELCRSTAADEGAALAMAICERFCNTNVFLYVTTHYPSLANLSNLYLNVKTWQMETVAEGDTPQDLTLDFRFRVIPGVTNLKHYGVYIVKKIWPQSILQEAYDILENFKKYSVNKQYFGVNEAIRLKYKLESDFKKLKSLGKLTTTSINNLLNDYQNDLKRMGISLLDRNAPEDDLSQYHTDVLETSSYNQLSNFLQEDSDNINMLVPELSIASSEREIQLNEEREVSMKKLEEMQEDDAVTQFSAVPSEWNDSLNEEYGVNGRSEEINKSELCSTPISQPIDIEDSNLEKKLTLKEKKDESSNLDEVQNTPSSTVWCVNLKDLSNNEVKSIMEELEIASKSLLEDDEDFNFSQVTKNTSFKTVCNEINEAENQHIFPIVNVVEGPQWTQESSLSTSAINKNKNEENDLESITYSPLCSQISFENHNLVLNRSNVLHTSTSSSLHFFNRNDARENNYIREINLDNGSTDKENIKSISEEKPNSVKTSTSSSLKESDSEAKKLVRRKLKRFVPPKKLTKKEIQEEFDEQDRRIYGSDIPESDLTKYLSKILNRPSVRQVQNSKHLAFVRKTEEGVEVIPTMPEPMKKKKTSFKRNLSNSSNIDMSIFSDKNAKCFNEFLNSDERDVKRFKFNFDSVKEKTLSEEFNFQPQSISEYAENVEKIPFSFKFQNSAVSSQHSKLLTPTLSERYYKQNREDINNIVNKYLQEEKGNIFESCSVHENDFDL